MSEIRVMASAAFKPAYLELVPEFERATGHKVVTDWVSTVHMMQRLKGDESPDLVIMASDAIEELTQLGKLAAGSSVALVKSGIGVAVRKGAARIDISSGASVKSALLAAKSIAYSTGPSGVYLVGLFQRMGIADLLQPKLKVVQGEPAAAAVARGEVEIAFQQISELLPVAGIDLLGPLPPDIQHIAVFQAALSVRSQQPEAARALVKFFTSPAAHPVIRAKGLEPA